MSRKSSASAILTVVILALGDAAGAQFRQYTPPGGGEIGGEERKEALARAVEDARWHAGPLRLDPALWISDLSWVDSPSAGVDSDFTARAGAGVRAFLPVGSKTTFAGYALPEYIWWNEREDERRLNQRFGVGSFTYFNRLRLELSAERNEDFDFATSETFERVTTRQDRLLADVEVPVFRALAVYAGGEAVEFETLTEDEGLENRYGDLDRDDRFWRGGLRYYPQEKFYVGAGVGATESTFAEETGDRSNSGDFWYAELGLERPKLSVKIDYREHELEAEDGSGFGSYEDSTGDAMVEWRPRESLAFRVYGDRSLVYSIAQSSFVDERFGAGARVKLGWRLELDLYAESGTQDYLVDLGGPGVSNDVESYGGKLTVELTDLFEVGIGYYNSTISSGVGLPDRELDEIRGTLSFGLGGGAASWY